ncbi:UDP-N-acetylmuramate dehydrogenase [Fimbriimonas ginsengisoli]|uniref:UDP-N-acetylenolpyruvoylglucosamine reductase n=1 Tax=Fimbriimonas ginsengisoli Gsoil 348 TaxID=661478 RepID=A0A068NU60_FIMGI|nr:UDP-N-acetylmuramate dehydrogenase [Fimbriimonas ginsengisoli]AIE87038.1 UDP-N-acetylenolpyruvylglucosamine reductase [Fimbriimonas ginsengisoli Gsoil 348]
MANPAEIRLNVPLRPYTTLRAGGPAERFAIADDVEQLASLAEQAQLSQERATVLGSGSNVLPSDAGVPGLTILNLARRIRIARTGEVVADTGCGFQELFLKTAQCGLHGLEFAVGIPGTLGGALVSNAGAYRSNISEFLTSLEIVHEGKRQWVSPDWMQFSYRDSVLRRPNPPAAVVLRVSMRLPVGEPMRIYDEAREYQRQRIGKQPPSPSAGSFFKNVNDRELAESLETLPGPLKMAGVVPAGYLIEASGLKGFRMGGAMLGRRHANFVLNVGGASATEIRRLAAFTRETVYRRFQVSLEEEVLYLGDWSGYSQQ